MKPHFLNLMISQWPKRIWQINQFWQNFKQVQVVRHHLQLSFSLNTILTKAGGHLWTQKNILDMTRLDLLNKHKIQIDKKY